MTHSAAEPLEPNADSGIYEAWRDLQDVLEERDREYWADQNGGEEAE